MKIFWSWQSDHPGAISRHLVRNALEIAVASLNEDLAIEEPEREVILDHDRKGVPGSPDLANIILDKIRASDVFIADVTPVGATSNLPPKSLMNSNVAIELGYALHTITDRRLIMVMNEHYGTRADLPFDLQHKAGPIFYDVAPTATKDQITSATKLLAGTLKTALREMLPDLGSQTATFQEMVAQANNPARYFSTGLPLVVRGRQYGNPSESFTVAATPTLYLRVMPTKKTVPLKRTEAFNAVRQGPLHLEPFYEHRGGTSFESNEFGAIAFDADYETREIVSGAQLFLNREIWAFNTLSFSPALARSLNRSLGIPTLTVERTFALYLPTYVEFLRERLGVAPPYRIEGGAFDVKDYLIFMPDNFIERKWGPIHERHVRWSGMLESSEAKAVDHALLNIFEALFDAGACARPKKLYGFPSDVHGTLPRG